MLVTGADLGHVRIRLAGYPFKRISADISAPRISACLGPITHVSAEYHTITHVSTEYHTI